MYICGGVEMSMTLSCLYLSYGRLTTIIYSNLLCAGVCENEVNVVRCMCACVVSCRVVCVVVIHTSCVTVVAVVV